MNDSEQLTPTGRPAARSTQQRPPTSDSGSELSPTVPLHGSGNPRPGRARTLRAHLTDRDRAILRTLADFRLMTGRQLGQLYIDSPNPTTAARRTRAVLQRLHDLRVITRLERRIGGIRAGSEGQIYGLSGLGQAILAIDDDQRRHGRLIGETKPAFQDHALAIADLYVQIMQRHRDAQLELLTFETEPTAWRRFIGVLGEPQVLKPDAFTALGVGDFEQRAFVEVDCATESLPTIQRKCRRYINYWRTAREQQDHGVFPRVWWLVPTERRRRRIAETVAALTGEQQQLFGVGLIADGVLHLCGELEAQHG